MAQVRPKIVDRFVLIRAKQSVKKHEELAAIPPVPNTDAEILEAFMSLLVNRLFDRMKPMLTEMLTNKSAIEVPTCSSDAVTSRHRENRPKRLRAGVIGLLPIQAQEVIGTYPDIEFVFIEDGGRTSDIKAKLRNVDVVFGLTSKMPHSAETTIKSMPIWDKYVRVPGKGTTSVKRSIELWINSRK